MKRFAAGLGGLLFGLLLSWASLYLLSRAGFQQSNGIPSGCSELEHCPHEWWTYPAMFAFLLGPSVAFSVANAMAAGRWTARRWATINCGLVVATIAMYVVAYAA